MAAGIELMPVPGRHLVRLTLPNVEKLSHTLGRSVAVAEDADLQEALHDLELVDAVRMPVDAAEPARVDGSMVDPPARFVILVDATCHAPGFLFDVYGVAFHGDPPA